MNILIFGANGQGFHGAGGAAYAFCGSFDNQWRTSPRMMDAISGKARQGLYNVWGSSRGYSKGTIGGAYAIQTVTHPGHRRSIALADIRQQVNELLVFMRNHPDKTFFIIPFGVGFAGYAQQEMDPIFDLILAEPNGKPFKSFKPQ